jgi:uncharacterized protein with HEPN domain
MPADRDRRWLQDMVDSAQRAIAYVGSKTEVEFYGDYFLQDAAAWRVTIIGEAARRVTDPSRVKIPGLPWKLIVQMRNKLVHEYAHVRADILWATIQDDLPKLISEIRAYLASGRTSP